MARNILLLCFSLLFSIHIQAKECINLVISGPPERPFWSELIRGSAAAAQELDIDLHLRGVNKESKEKSQILTIQYLTDTFNCKGILLAHQPIHIGFDESELIIKSVKENRLYGYLKQDSFHMGYYGVNSLYKILHGEEFTPEIDIPVTFITQQNFSTERE